MRSATSATMDPNPEPSLDVGRRVSVATPDDETDGARAPIGDPETVAVIDMAPGCDLRRDTCAVKFGNLLNFGGFPDIPGRNPFGGTSIV